MNQLGKNIFCAYVRGKQLRQKLCDCPKSVNKSHFKIALKYRSTFVAMLLACQKDVAYLAFRFRICF
ncbi:hypothetical protein X975_23901, partial [Stegodyphus mimosarum]